MESRIWWKDLPFVPSGYKKPTGRLDLWPWSVKSGSGRHHKLGHAMGGHGNEGDDDSDVEDRADIGWPALVAALGTPTLHYTLGRGDPKEKKRGPMG